MPNPNPIGVFDSGVGGISAMKEIRRLLPAEDIIYYADSAHCPYGTKNPAFIRRRIKKVAGFLTGLKVKIIVAACNTASIAGIDFLRQTYPQPIVGMEPAVKPAAALTKNGKVGVMATGVTLTGERFHSLIRRFAGDTEVITVPCPGLVERVELGLLDDPETERLVQRFLDPLVSSGVDTVVLGCPHYPFRLPLVKSVMGPSVPVPDPGNPVARRVAQVLEENDLQKKTKENGREFFFTSGNLATVGRTISILWGDDEEAKVKLERL
ncbi:MAG: glutamate racemase [Firmicutes bacterium]|nr:glutamate racemase [Bacillota bacterium]